MDWRFSCFLLSLFALLVGIPWATSEVGLCGVKIAIKAATGDDATTCFEFWINRYQTLITGLLAVAAAVISIASYRKQALLAQHAVLHSRAVALRDDVIHLEKAEALLGRARIQIDDLHQAMHSIIDQSLTINREAIFAILQSSEKRMRNYGLEIRGLISGRQKNIDLRAALDDFVRGCDEAAEQTWKTQAAAERYIHSRDKRSKFRALRGHWESEEYASPEAEELRLVNYEAKNEAFIALEKSEVLLQALGSAISKCNIRIATYEAALDK